jgi:hypothetical protein
MINIRLGISLLIMFTLIVFVPNLINNYVDIAAAEP